MTTPPQNKLKILIASDTYYPSVNGAAYFSYRLATQMANRGHKVYVMAPSRVSKNSITKIDEVTVYGLRSISVPIYPDFRVSPLMLARKSIKKFVAQIEPDIIHIQNHFMIGKGVTNAALQLKIPIMGTNHFMPENLVYYFHLPNLAENKLKQFSLRQFRQVYDKLDLVTAPTKTAADLVKAYGYEKEVVPLSCGIDLERFNPALDGSYLLEKYNLPKDCQILLYAGRLDKEKRIEIILEAVPEILKKTKAHLVVAGTGKYRKLLETMVKKMGLEKHVTFTGFVPDNDLPALYCLAQVFIIAGVAELQSIVTMEAMACGLPVVAVNAVALPELVHDKVNGFLFEDGDSQALAQDVIKILNNQNLRQQMSKESLRIIQKHEINKVMEKFEKIYIEVINQHKPYN